jgi:hypothetical protein
MLYTLKRAPLLGEEHRFPIRASAWSESLLDARNLEASRSGPILCPYVLCEHAPVFGSRKKVQNLLPVRRGPVVVAFENHHVSVHFCF